MPELGKIDEARADAIEGRMAPGVDDSLARERKATQAADPSGRRYRFLAKAIPQIIWTASPSGQLDSFNPRWTEVTGLPCRPNQPRQWRQALHPDDIPRWIEGWGKARASGQNLNLDVRLRRADGSYRWHLVRATPIRNRAGVLLKWLGTCTDIDGQKQAEGMLGFLAEVSKVLASSLDYETTLAAVARLSVPHVADWCAVDILVSGGGTRRLAVAHLDPSRVELGWELARRYPLAPGDPSAILRVLETGRTEVEPVVDQEALAASARDPEHLAMLRASACSSSISAALTARGRTLGVITFAMAESERRYGKADVPLVEDLARRAGMAVDNARLYREARKAREEAEAANRAKDRFLAVLSHELRTPLTPVLAEVSAMLDDPATPDSVRPILEMTRRNVELEARLIDDLLDLNRIVQGKLRLDRRVVDAHRLIRESLEICRSGVEAARLRVELSLVATRHHVNADAARLQQVTWNLIKNAVKFTPEGGFIAIRTRDEGDRLVVEVADTGVGIEGKALARIFDAFDQGDGSITQRFGGLGLGLAIGRSLAEAHGGRLTASSPGLNQGATFRLDLPTVDAPSIQTEAAPSVAPPGDQEARPVGPLRILLVEDNLDTLRVMARLLLGRGHVVVRADSVASALAAAEDGEFDLLVSDLGLPDGSGLDLIRGIRALRLGQTMPGIALSGYGLDDDIRRSQEAGFLEHLVKPVDFTALEAAIRRVARARPQPSISAS